MGRVTRVLDSFANTLLDLGLPKIKEWLKSRLGPNADVGKLTTEGRKVHLESVTIPIGPRGLLELARATCTLASSGRGGLPGARLSFFEGVLTFGGSGEPSFTAKVAFEETANDEDAWVHGKLGIAEATWSEDGIVREGHVPMNGKARLVVTSTGWEMADGTLETGTAHVSFAGAGKLEGDGSLGRASLVAKQARTRHFIDALTALAGAALPLVVPAALGDPMLDGEVSFADGRGKGSVRLASDAFDLTIEGELAIENAEPAIEATIEGKAFPGKLLVAAGAREEFVPDEDAEAHIDLVVTGSASRPVVRGSIAAAVLPFRFGRARFLPPLSAREVRVAIVDSDREHVALEGGLTFEGRAVDLAANIPFAPAGKKTVHIALDDLEAEALAAVLGVTPLRALVALEGDDTSHTGAKFFLPRFTRTSGHVKLTRDAENLEAEGALAFETPRSALALDLRSANGTLDGSKLRGTLAFADALAAGLFPFEIRPGSSGALEGELDLSGPPDDLLLEGKVTSDAVEVVLESRPEVPAFVFTDVAGHLSLGRKALAYRDIVGRGYGGTLRLHGRVLFDAEQTEDRLVLTVERAEVDLLDALARLATGGVPVRREKPGTSRPKNELWIPAGTLVNGEVRLDDAMRMHASAGIEHGDTALLADIVLSPELALDGSTLRGKVALADALLAGAFDTTLAPLPEGIARIDATLKGRLDEPVLAGVATAASLRVGMRGSPNLPPYALGDLTTMFRVDRQKIVWHKLSATAYEGTVRSSGMIRFTTGAEGIRSSVDWSDVDLGALPIANGDRLGTFVRGTLGGRMDFDRQGPEGRPITGHGKAVVTSAEYPVVQKTASMVARYGLPPPSSRGVGDLTLAIDLSDRGWRFSDVTASVDSCLLTGAIGIGFDTRMEGRFVVNVGERYLRQSTLLFLPAVFAETIDIPVHLGGDFAHPLVRTDIGASLGHLLVNNRITGILDEAVEDMSSLLGLGGRRPPPQPMPLGPENEPEPPPPLDTRDEDEIVKEMIKKGADWDEIEWRLDELRRSRGPRYRIE